MNFKKEKHLKYRNYKMMKIGGLQKLSLIDYPGKLACTVFCLGCDFRCPFCYNSELVLPSKIKNQPKISEKEFFKFLKEKRELLEGVCITGGEPTIHKDLPDFIKKIKKLGYLVKLDTNGSNPEMFEELIVKKLIDYAAVDIKTSFESGKYNKAAGVKVDLNKIKKTLALIRKSGIDYELRTTIVPTIHTKEDIVKIVREIHWAKKYYLQSFKPDKTVNPKFKKIKPYPREYILEIHKAVVPFFETCLIR